MLLADYGADVIKVEDPNGGDYIRWWEPLVGKNSGYHVVLNRGKRSLTLNLKKPEGKEIFKQLVKDADVLLEGFRPDVMGKLGLGYDDLKKINPRLVYCCISGYGATGPRAPKAGHDINYLALGGILSYCGQKGQPTTSGVQIADLGGGALFAVFSIAAALYARERLGEGQYLDISMADCAMTWNCLRWGKYLGDGVIPSTGDDFLNHGYACYNIYETKDGRHMSVGALEPQFWKVFCETMEHPGWNTKEYFKPGPHQDGLRKEIADVFAQKTLSQWIAVFSGKDCCVEPILTLEEAMQDEHNVAREMIVNMRHDAWGAYRQLGVGAKMSLTPGKVNGHAPDLGEHTGQILAGLGMDNKAQEKLKADGVI